jgi:peptidoglycan/xylan/chitin deacetylase (PgdA/CDA1 family)
VSFRTPQAYSFTLFLSFDLDVDSAEVLRGEDPVALSRGRFAVKRGLWKVLNILEMFGVKSTFFVPGWVAEKYEDVVREILSKGHEVAAHGYLHEKFDLLSKSEEENVFYNMVNAIRKVTGAAPKGFRAPYWRFSPRTLENIVKYNLIYDSSLMDEEVPYVINVGDRNVVELPVDWRLDDWVFLETNRCINYRDLLDMWVDEIDYANEVNGYISITLHPQCIGRGARIRILEALLSEAIKRNAWIPTGRELAKYVLKSS